MQRLCNWLERKIGPPTLGGMLALAMIPCGAIILYVMNTESAARAQAPVVFGEKPPADAGSCVLIFPVGDLTKVLLQLPNNTVLLDAREHVIELRPGASPLVTCKLYRGIYRPTAPVAKTWQVAEIKFVEMDIFQKLVDEAIGNAEGAVPVTDEDEPTGKAPRSAKGPPLLPTVPLNPNSPR